MISYLLIAVIAWSLFGLLSIVDKFLLDKPINNASVYTYYTGLFSVFMVLLFAPFTRFHSVQQVVFDILCGLIFLAFQYCLFKAIISGTVSEVVPVTGALVPIFSLLFTSYGLHLLLTPQQAAAFGLLVGGTVAISYKGSSKHLRKKTHAEHFTPILWAIAASLLSAAYYTMAKAAFAPFKENFGLVRFGSLLGAMLMLLVPEVRASVHHLNKKIKTHSSGAGTAGLFVGKSILAGVGFIILNFAISIGNPALVNALQGVEYAVIFILAVFLSHAYPKVLKEETERKLVTRKVIAIAMIFLGFMLLQIS